MKVEKPGDIVENYLLFFFHNETQLDGAIMYILYLRKFDFPFILTGLDFIYEGIGRYR
jgi:hypothetical protein